MTADGAAFVDRSGRVLAADETFRARLGLRADAPDATAALRERARAEPALKALLDGAGPDRVRLAADGDAYVELARFASESGMLLVTREEGLGGAPQELLEHAVRSQALTRIAAGMAHDVKNPLNALALQLAILTDKLADAGAQVSQTSAHHLTAMRDQISRVNEVIRRFVDVTDPAPALGWTDLGGLVGDAATLYGHDARRRRIELVTDLPPSAVRCPADAGRLSRTVLGLFWRALAETPVGGKMAVRVVNDGPEVLVEVEHTPGHSMPEGQLVVDVVSRAAAELGGRLDAGVADGKKRYALRLPRDGNGDVR